MCDMFSTMLLLLCFVVVDQDVISVVFFTETATTESYTYLHTLSLHDALPILSRLDFHRLLVAAQTSRTARRAHGAAPGRRHDLLCDARNHPWRAARLCAVLQSRQLSRKAARNLQIVGRRHVAARRGDRRARRDLVCDEEGKAELPAL